MGFSGSLQKMVVKAYSDSGFNRPAGEYRVWINPEKYTHSYRICYNDTQAQGSSGGSPNFNRTPADEVQFELVFDGTGVVPTPLPGVLPYTKDGIASEVEKFKQLVFAYDGNIHSPRYLQLVWGTMLFNCRLTSLRVDYTLFKPDGTPLRARAAASFRGFTDEVTLAKKAKKSSPDLTHVRTVKAGDTLPLMCWQVYGSSAWYVQVAAVNGLADFRDLRVGTELTFPPLEDAAR
jgi:phage tail protein X